MPLAFDSISHKRITFGFFNIDSDMLILEQFFFFADYFCGNVLRIASSDSGEAFHDVWKVYHIPEPADIGDLMGAIHKVHYTGFIGETYKRYPFPEQEKDFKQKPEGDKTQDEFRNMIKKYAVEVDIPVAATPDKQVASIGDYEFTVPGFQELVKYVWRGGMPRWRDEERPAYVDAMKDRLEESKHWLFKGLALD